MSSTKDGAASNKVMSAMGEVETFIAAVKEKTADEVRDAARAFEKKTGGAVSGLGVTRANPEAFAETHGAEIAQPLSLPVTVLERFDSVVR